MQSDETGKLLLGSAALNDSVNTVTHFAFVSPPLSGHLDPMLALGRVMKQRGHRVTFFGQVDTESKITGAGLGFIPVGLQSHPRGSLVSATRTMGSVRGLVGIGAVISEMARSTAMLASELPSAFERAGVEAVISDQLEAAGGLVALRTRLPFASIANALLINREAGLPPYFSHWLPDNSPWAERRNRGAETVSDWMMRRHSDVIRSYANAHGLAGRFQTAEDCLSPYLQISQTVRGFDFPRRSLPSTVHYVGPMRQPEIVSDWPHTKSRPLVFASFGTLFGGRARLFKSAARACARIGAQLVIAHGGRLTPTQISELPGQPYVADFVPQRAVLAVADACITHAGMNTMMDSLGAGVPAITIPFAFDQPGVAARLEWSRAGVRIQPRNASPSALQAALLSLLRDPSYRQNAASLQAEIRAAGGVERAADLIESRLTGDIARIAHAPGATPTSMP